MGVLGSGVRREGPRFSVRDETKLGLGLDVYIIFYFLSTKPGY